MQVASVYRHAPVSAQKVRLVANQIRGLSAEKATVWLRFSTKKTASLVKKAVDSAIANAEHNLAADIDELFITKIYVDEGSKIKRFRARARGRGNRILKRFCHITVVVSDNQV